MFDSHSSLLFRHLSAFQREVRWVRMGLKYVYISGYNELIYTVPFLLASRGTECFHHNCL